MEVNLLLIQLAVIFLPGIIWERLDARYAAKVKPESWEILLRALIFGLIAYCVEFIIYGLLGAHFVAADFAHVATQDVVTWPVIREILEALPISFGLALIWLYSARYKWLTRFLQSIRATRKFGDEDVWDYTFNSETADVEYVHVRDFKNGYVYAGWVNTFSESDKLRELVLLDAIVYDLNGGELYRIRRIYLARQPEDMHIEFPYIPPATPGVDHD